MLKLKKNNLFLSFIYIILSLSIFFMDFIGSFTNVYFIVTILLLIYTLISGKISLNQLFYPMIILLILVISNVFIGGEINYIITFSLNIMLFFLLTNFSSNNALLYKIIALFSFFHLLMSILVFVMPEPTISSVFSILLGSSYNPNYNWRVVNGINLGISTQPGAQSVYLMVFFAYCYSNLIISEKRKIVYLLGALLSILFIFMTTKRATILIVILTSFIVYFIINKKKFSFKKVLKIVITTCLIIFAIFLINDSIGILNNFFEKTISLLQSDDVTNGRIDLWKFSLEQFLINPAFGIGFKQIYHLTGLDVHNIYLQFLVESGVVGFIILISAIAFILKYANLKLKYTISTANNTNRKYVIFGYFLLIYLLLYGFVGNTFIDYLPLSIFSISLVLLNSNRGVYKNEN